MKLHRFIGAYDLKNKTVKITDPETIKQIKAVLRLEIGDKILLSDGKGSEAEASIESMSQDGITCKIEAEVPSHDPERKVHLYLAILKKENFELAVQKAVESGVSSITPVVTERTIKTGLNTARLEKIIREASEQCGRSIVPALFPILNYKDALAAGRKTPTPEGVGVPTENVGIIFHLNEKEYVPDKNSRDIKNVSIFIGPEGGFTDNEVSLAKEHGYIPASLGPLTLRGETAAIIATYRAVQAV